MERGRGYFVFFVALLGLTLVASFIGNFYVYQSPPGIKEQCAMDNTIDRNWLDAYKRYLRDNENGGKEGWDPNKELWSPIGSPEGGFEICYGHKLQRGEPPISIGYNLVNPPLSDAQCEQLLHEDIEKHWKRARDCLESRHPAVTWCELSPDKQLMLTDYEFTGTGCRIFPKLTKAIIEGDWDAACREYKRYYTDPNDGKKKPLRKRNDDFCRNFLEPYGCDCGDSGQDFNFPSV